MVGLRGVGKTVLLDRMRDDAEGVGIHSLRLEAPEGRSVPALLAPQLRQALLRLSIDDRARALAHRGLRALAGFAKALKVKYADIEVGLDFDPEPGLADNGDLEHDLQARLETAGEAAKAAGTALITGMHRVAQRPQLRGRMGRAKSYAERLFDFPEIGPLFGDAARLAIVKPVEHQGESITEAAQARIVGDTQGYPYFLQEWGKHSWQVADASPISVDDVERATPLAVAALDQSRTRAWTPSIRRYR